ncbi:hypothetical protein GCM10010321_23280 [Streptomyces chartreusis]|nr:hypothetical protein GCM10010321_23280 [Streptomyces chartreusis]
MDQSRAVRDIDDVRQLVREPVQRAGHRHLGDLRGLLGEQLPSVGGEVPGHLRRRTARGQPEGEVEFTDQVGRRGTHAATVATDRDSPGRGSDHGRGLPL